jgi:chromosome segregation ATPase
LYRNGTTGAELFEIISEKTAEINDLKKALATKTENLQKLAKSSGDMMAQYSSLQASYKALSNSHDSLTLTHKSTTSALDALQAEHASLIAKSAAQDRDLATSAAAILKLQSELADSQTTVEKLHARCASLVAEKTSALKQLDNERFERAEREKELQSELQAIRQTCFDFKKEFDTEAHEKLRISRQLADSKGVITDIKSAIDLAHRMRVQSELDLKRCREEYEHKIAILTESKLQMKLEHEKVVQQVFDMSLLPSSMTCRILTIHLCITKYFLIRR